MRYGWLIPLALLALTHATGIVTVGLVTTGSMEPAMVPGSLFFSHRSDPETGDIVVYTHPDGHQVVHRVVDVSEQGLITQGDANEQSDQAAGVPAVDPAVVTVVPTVGDQPAAVSLDGLKPISILAGQALLLTYAVRSFASRTDEAGLGWPLNRLQASHLLLAAGLLLLATAPFLVETMDARAQIEVQGLVLPAVAAITSSEGVEQRTLGPLETQTVSAAGQTEIVRAPALPGASTLARLGAVWAMLPTAIVLWAGGLLLRWEGR